MARIQGSIVNFNDKREEVGSRAEAGRGTLSL
jgi:hypothetical protein